MSIKIIYLLLIVLATNFYAYGQSTTFSKIYENKFTNWYNKEFAVDGVLGTSVDKAYRELIKSDSASSEAIIVAVIDGGVDINHPDLAGRIWNNPNEIAGNGIDDDGNGYIDDIHGWNFIGNASGENIAYENLEYTRIIRDGNTSDPQYPRAKKMYYENIEKTNKELNMLIKFTEVYQQAQTIIYQETGVLVETKVDLMEVNSTKKDVLWAKKFLNDRLKDSFTPRRIEEFKLQVDEFINYYLNLDFKPRAIIGDDPTDIKDSNYGNADVIGPDPSHGTSVAGVIAAIRDNELGINGIASNVKIMVLRSIPNGDERDKDVAMSIRYAVDNGARIINMSFGKDFSPEKQFVDEAVHYAASKDVLLVHAAGNEGQNIDIEESYPNPYLQDGTQAKNWISVGASSFSQSRLVAAEFSNYGQKNVGIFAPGMHIISTDKSNEYSINDGTSLAAPVVSGIAALILSQHPSLSSEELINLIYTTSNSINKPRKVFVPSLTAKKRKKAKFSSLSKSGGIINAYNALIKLNENSTLNKE